MEAPGQATVISSIPLPVEAPATIPKASSPPLSGAQGSSQGCLLGDLGPQLPGRLEAEHFFICDTWGEVREKAIMGEGASAPLTSASYNSHLGESQRPRKSAGPSSLMLALTSSESWEVAFGGGGESSQAQSTAC